jgi:tRNA threonylcarbamoyladenosine biosynthesis protein TsaB
VITLAIDASTYGASVCIARGRDIIVARDVAMRDAQRERLMPAVGDALAEARLDPSDLDRIVCGSGPGSFTSLRIAAAIAKGLALAAGKPLYAISSLALMLAAVEPPLPPGEYVATLDALRAEYYVTSCTLGDGGEVVDATPVTLADAIELDGLERAGRTLVGERGSIRAVPSARGVVRVEPLLQRNGPANLALWEPDYGRVAEAQRRWEAAHGRPMPRG